MMNHGRSMMKAGRRGTRDGVGWVRGVVTRISGRRARGGSGGAWVIAALAFAACDDSGTQPDPGPEGPSTLTVDAREAWAYVELGTPAVEAAPADPLTSADWDIGFMATAVMLNGGAAGPGEVSGYCLCENASATDEEILALTPAAELAAFEVVDMTAVPVDEEDWMTDALAPAIDEWYSYDVETHVVSAAPENVWLVRTADGLAIAKFHVIDIQGAAQQHPGTVTIEYALRPSEEVPFGDVQTAGIDASSGSVHFDLESGAVTDESDWDIRIEGYTMRVNGGVSGGGNAGAARLDGSFDSITDDIELPPNASYSADAFGGVFEAHPWYRYDLEGNHRIWPTYDVYIIRADSDIYKVQLINYYDDADDARYITFRYARLEG